MDAIELIASGRLALVLEWTDGQLAGMDLVWSEGVRPTPDPSPQARRMQAALDDCAAGREPAWPDVPLRWEGVRPFARQVLETLRREAGFGRTVSYGELAALAGRPDAARAVGRIMASNPWPLLFPCHRVIGSTGRLTGFGGAGLPMKEHLLRLEGALQADGSRKTPAP